MIDVLILCAGLGSRLKHFTSNRPKCMVEVANKPIINYTIDVFSEIDSNFNVSLVTGYFSEALNHLDCKKIHNELFATTNMLYSLYLGMRELSDTGNDGELIICYGDIIFDKRIVEDLLLAEGDIVLPSNSNWKEQWSARYDNPLVDLETFRVNSKGCLVDIGRKPVSFHEIQGQYMGIIKLSDAGRRKVLVELVNLFNDDFDRNRNMHLTGFFNYLISKGARIDVLKTQSYWFEIDNIEDLIFAEENLFR